MRFINRQVQSLFLASTVILLSGCSKKPERETVPVTTDTLSETIDTLPETHDTLSVTIDPLSVTFDTFTDTRDGKTYRTVKIGRYTWMAENLNYKPESGNHWCYNYYYPYCKKYGRLYDWETAKTACPAGWHLPSFQDWEYLVKAVGGKRGNADVDFIFWLDGGKILKAKSGWRWYDNQNESGNGTDDYGFSALPGGAYGKYNSFFEAGDNGYWWTATLKYGYYYRAYYRDISYNDYGVHAYDGNTLLGLSVRCTMD
jgi:uncharacterized protein (TIGR02145 family)